MNHEVEEFPSYLDPESGVRLLYDWCAALRMIGFTPTSYIWHPVVGSIARAHWRAEKFYILLY